VAQTAWLPAGSRERLFGEFPSVSKQFLLTWPLRPKNCRRSVTLGMERNFAADRPDQP
jgi:hypothetical protein